MAVETVRIKGLRELNSALHRFNRDVGKELDRELLAIGMLIAENARNRFGVYDQKSAMGFRPRMRGFGRLVVEQRYRKKTGQHPEFGSLQMQKALLPARREEEPALIAGLEGMLERLGRENGF